MIENDDYHRGHSIFLFFFNANQGQFADENVDKKTLTLQEKSPRLNSHNLLV